MNYYETLYIVHPALDSGRLKDIILSIQDTISNININIISTDIWGKKKLAYLIDKQKYGTYVLVQFEGDGQTNNKISLELEHNPNILSYLTSKITKNELQQNVASLDEQIGSTKFSESTEAPAEEATEESAKAPAEESTEAPAEEATEESAKAPAEESTEESNNENSEENHGSNE